MVARKTKDEFSIMNFFKMGFGLGLGLLLSQIIYMMIAVAFFMSGLYLLTKERKKSKEEKSDMNIIGAYVLMALGTVFGLGLGFNFILSNFESDF